MKVRFAALITACAAAFVWYAEPLKSENLAGLCVSSKTPRPVVIAACTSLIEAKDVPPDYRHLFLTERAWAHRCNGHYDKAIADVDHALKLQPQNVKTRVLRARIHAANGNSQAAREDYDLAVEQSPENSYTHWNRARYLEKQGARSEAFQGYQRVLDLNPEASNAAKYIASYHFAAEEYEKALAVVSDAKTRWPDLYWIYNTQIQLDIIHTQDVKSALNAAEKIIALSDTPAMKFIAPAAVHLTIGDDKKGIETVERYAAWYEESVAAKRSLWDWITGKSPDHLVPGESGEAFIKGIFYLVFARDDLARPQLLQFWEMSDQATWEHFVRHVERRGTEVQRTGKENGVAIIDAYIEQELSKAPRWAGRK
ncbi:tetratricopeptide repeat protein [Ruegeria sp.]|uniref:tetratricopeptide repeat protein n=1 Tax=Ruegeria sp. TaxID=1879320 RepID=UPI0023221792|nr:tetratricopeptide repeat protein [Ruegeria sp.]MDA7965164.1 tetratricopeptide repeat protein [Ruegeria sp.]